MIERSPSVLNAHSIPFYGECHAKQLWQSQNRRRNSSRISRKEIKFAVAFEDFRDQTMLRHPTKAFIGIKGI